MENKTSTTIENNFYSVKLSQLELVIVENLIFKETQTNDKISKSDRNILNDVAIRMNKTRHGEID